MFCINCGAPLEDGAVFCSSCGQRQDGEGPAPAAEPDPYYAPDPEAAYAPGADASRNRIIGMAVVGAIVAVVVILAVILFSGRGYKASVNKFFDATFDPNAKVMASLIPKSVIKAAMEENDYDSKKEMIEELQDSLEDSIEYMDRYYDEWDVSWEIRSTKDLKTSDIRDLEDYYDDYLDVDLNIKKAMTVDVKLTVVDEDGNKDKDTVTLTLIKVGASWYIDLNSMGAIY